MVELLVVITILAVLAALGLVVGNKMLAKGKATQLINNLRQMAPVFNTYAAENQLRLPACNGPEIQADGSVADMQWNEVLLTYLFPDTDAARFKTEQWWDSNRSLMRNPLFEDDASPNPWTPLNPGYGYNLMLAENYSLMVDEGIPGEAELLATRVPTGALDEPSRTPLVAPYDNYYYRLNESEVGRFSTVETLQRFMTDGKLPILFLGGNVELLSPIEYGTRELDEMPR